MREKVDSKNLKVGEEKKDNDSASRLQQFPKNINELLGHRRIS